jgi:hypothetical protein
LKANSVANEPLDLTPLGAGLGGAGAVALLVAQFLPMAQSASIGIVGRNMLISSNGGYVLILFAIGSGCAIYRGYQRPTSRTWVPIVLGAWSLGIAIYQGTDSSNLNVCPPSGFGCVKAGAGLGIYVSALGALLVLVGGLFMVGRSHSSAEVARDKDVTKQCPDCAEDVRLDARVCKHCGFRFEPEATASS